MAGLRNDDDEHSQPGQAPGGGWVPIPDPTTLTDAAIARSTDIFRREIIALRETLETRLDAADQDRSRIWERLRDLPALYEQFTVHLREEMFRQDEHDREVFVQRLDDLDRARERGGDELDTRLERGRREFLDDLAGVRELVEQRMAGMDHAVELMAAETARSLTTADQGDERIRSEMHSLATSLRELIEQRLSAMDLATKVLAGSVEKFPSDLDRAVGNSREVVLGEILRVGDVTQEKFSAVDALFASNALALAAALAAQEKAVAAQNDSNTLAISKSESSTKETIAANAAQAQTANASLAAQVTDIKERVVRMESMGVGASANRTETRETRADQRLSQNAVVSIVVAFVITAGVVISLIALLHH